MTSLTVTRLKSPWNVCAIAEEATGRSGWEVTLICGPISLAPPVGIQLIEVGIADRFSGAGVRDTEAWEIGDAITDRTAAVCYVAYTHTLPILEKVVEAAHAHDVPVIVDAAGQLPPADNLRKFISQGADLVAFSGGKAIGGPQSSGILCGRRDLIMSVALQHKL